MPGGWENHGEKALLNKCVFKLHMKNEREPVVWMSSGSSFHKVGASNAKLWPKCFVICTLKIRTIIAPLEISSAKLTLSTVNNS